MKKDNVVNISFGRLGGPTYIGRPNGEAARESLKLDEYDLEENVRFIVDIPDTTYSINSSYFLGLFGKSIRAAKTAENFYRRFQFNTHGKSYKAIERGVERALLTKKDLDID